MEETPAAYDRGSEIGVEKACYASGSVSPGSFFASFLNLLALGTACLFVSFGGRARYYRALSAARSVTGFFSIIMSYLEMRKKNPETVNSWVMQSVCEIYTL